MKTLLVNVADWDGPPDLPAGWLIANAPRPLPGERVWQGQFRHGVLYAALPAEPGSEEWDRNSHAAILRSWESLDGWRVEFITNDQITQRVVDHLAGSGYPDLEELAESGITVADIAAGMELPWHGGAR